MLAQFLGGGFPLHVYYGQFGAVLLFWLGVLERQELVYAILCAHLAKGYDSSSTHSSHLLSRSRSQILVDEAAHVVDFCCCSLEGQTAIKFQSILFDLGTCYDDFGSRCAIGDIGILPEILAYVQLLLGQSTRHGAQTDIY